MVGGPGGAGLVEQLSVDGTRAGGQGVGGRKGVECALISAYFSKPRACLTLRRL